MRSTLSILVCSAWLFSGPVCAAEWEVSRTTKGYFLKRPDFPELKIELKSLGGVAPQLLSVASWRAAPEPYSHLRLITYEAGKSGEGRTVHHVRSIIFDPLEGKILGDVPSSYSVSTTPRAAQPQWKWGPKQLVVEDLEFKREFRIPLGQ